MISIFVHQHGETHSAPRVDPAWFEAASGVTLWVDLSKPGPEEERLLSDVFRFHPLSVEDALSAIHHPKTEPYPDYLYLILHGIDFDVRREGGFATRDVDFFLGRNYLVTVHDGRSRSVNSSTIFLPLPVFPWGEEAQFWWVAAVMAAIAGIMLAVFRWNRWI